MLSQGPGQRLTPGTQLSIAFPWDSWSLFSCCRMSSSLPGPTMAFAPPCEPWLCWSRCTFTAAWHRRGPGLWECGKGLLSSSGGNRGPPDERAWFGFPVWQAALKLCCSCSGEFPRHARVAQGKELQYDASQIKCSRESKGYSSSWGH